MIIYYSIYTGCCSVMTIDCFSLYIWVYKDIIYMKMTYCRSKTLMRKSMYWNILIYLQHHFDKNIVCHSHTKSLEKVIRVYHIWEGRYMYICIHIYMYFALYYVYTLYIKYNAYWNDIWSKITNKQIVWSLSLSHIKNMQCTPS